MEYRPLGRTGVQASKLCLGTMMFGAWGNADHEDSIRIIHRALDAGINFVDTADVRDRTEAAIHGAVDQECSLGLRETRGFAERPERDMRVYEKYGQRLPRGWSRW
jgi:predicted aldo/keto reductase-like oxidoreductase